MTLLRISAAAIIAAACVPALASSGVPPRGLTGSPEGVALAKRVNLSYETVPGLSMTAVAAVEGSSVWSPLGLSSTTRLNHGNLYAIRESVTGRAGTHEQIQRPEATYRITSPEACWTRIAETSHSKDGVIHREVLGVPKLLSGKIILPRGGSAKSFYVIARATNRIESLTLSEGGKTIRIDFHELRTAPRIEAPHPLC